MNTKELKTVLTEITKIKDKGFEFLYFDNGFINYLGTDKYTSILYSRSIDIKGTGTIELNSLKKIVAKIKTEDLYFQFHNKGSVNITDGKNKFTLPSNYDNPFTNYSNSEELTDYFSFDVSAFPGEKFLSTDELRPQMCHYYIDNTNIVATDAHKLAFIKHSAGDVPGFKLSRSILKLFKGEMQIQRVKKGNDEILKIRCGKVTLYQHEYNNRYPDYKAIIPIDNHIELTLNRKDLMECLDMAAIVANQIVMTCNRQTTIESQDIDFETSYKREFPEVAKDMDTGITEEIRIGTNCIFFHDILKEIETPNVYIAMKSPNRVMIINDQYLLKPVMVSI